MLLCFGDVLGLQGFGINDRCVCKDNLLLCSLPILNKDNDYDNE